MATLTIQPSNIDAYIRSDGADINYGDVAYLIISTTAGSIFRSILKFDFSALPVGAIISAATLSLYLFSDLGDIPAGRTYWAYELTQTSWTEMGATWNKYNGTNPWTTAGGDYTTNDGASLVVPAINNWLNWNVLALVQHFQSAHAEIAHFLVKDGTENDAGRGGFFYSKEEITQTTLRPTLVITYTTPAVLTAEAGSYSITGQAAGLKAGRKIQAGAGSYALTGQAAGLKVGRKIQAGAGSYALTGQDAVLRAIRKLAAQGGSYVLTGYDANLVIGQHYILAAEAGSYGEPYSKIFVTLDGRIYKKMGDTYLRLS